MKNAGYKRVIGPWIENRVRASLTLPLCLVFAALGYAADGPANGVAPAPHGSSTPIVVGFVGGFVHPDDVRHAEVQLARRLSVTYAGRLHSAIFDNHHRKDAYRAIERWLDTDADGDLSDAERRASRIILYGHSWGAAAALSLARDLQRENIPVLLTIQVDSISKIGQNDRVVPANVAEAVNFYQTRGWLHGRTEITAADPVHTEILGQFRFDYPKQPTECHDYPWLTRHLFKGHTAIECDSSLWSQIGDLIDTTLSNGNKESANEAALH